MNEHKNKMDVKYWEGGLTLHEVRAIEKIAHAFGGSVLAAKENSILSS